MGNQGMTNWKFSAFFAIALILFAGLFSSTAMAAANDGHGTITVRSSLLSQMAMLLMVDDRIFSSQANPLFKPAILFANRGAVIRVGIYVHSADRPVNMQGGCGSNRNPPPDDGWTVPAAGVSATDTGYSLTKVNLFPVDSTAEGVTDPTADLIELTKSGDNATVIE